MCNSASFLDVRDQFPTTNLVCPALESIGWELVVFFTAALARWSFSRNSPRFSTETQFFQQLMTKVDAKQHRCVNVKLIRKR